MEGLLQVIYKIFHLRGDAMHILISFLLMLLFDTTPTNFNLFDKLTLTGFVERLWSDFVGECKLLTYHMWICTDHFLKALSNIDLF